MAQSQIVWAIFSRIAGGPSRSSSNRTSRAAGAIARTSLKVSPSCPNFIEGFAKLPAGQLLDRLGPFLALLPVRDRVDADVEQRGDLRVGEIFGIFERGGIANALGEFDGFRRFRLRFFRVFQGHFPPPHSFRLSSSGCCSRSSARHCRKSLPCRPGAGVSHRVSCASFFPMSYVGGVAPRTRPSPRL